MNLIPSQLCVRNMTVPGTVMLGTVMFSYPR